MWVKFSNGHFGFSVQKQIVDIFLKKIPNEYNTKDWEAFVDKVSWCVKKNGQTKRKWLTLSELNYSIKSPQGHLPVMLNQENDVQINNDFYFISWRNILQRLTTCRIH